MEFIEGIKLVPLTGEGIAEPPTPPVTEGEGVVADGTASAAHVIPGKQVWPDGQLTPSGHGVLDAQFSAASK